MMITKFVDTVFSVSDQLKIEVITTLVQDNTNNVLGRRGVPNMNLYKDWTEQVNEVTGTVYRKLLYKMRLVGPNGFNKTFSLRSKGMEIDGGDLYRIARYGEKILDRIYDANDDFAISRRDKSVYDSIHDGNVYDDVNGSFDPNDRLLYAKKAAAYGPRLELSNFAVINTGFRLFPMERRFPTPMAKNVIGIEMQLSPEIARECTQLGFDPYPILTEFELSELVDFCRKFDPVAYSAAISNSLCGNVLGWMSKNEFKDRTRQNSSYDEVVNTQNVSIQPKQTSRPDENIRRELSMLS